MKELPTRYRSINASVTRQLAVGEKRLARPVTSMPTAIAYAILPFFSQTLGLENRVSTNADDPSSNGRQRASEKTTINACLGIILFGSLLVERRWHRQKSNPLLPTRARFVKPYCHSLAWRLRVRRTRRGKQATASVRLFSAATAIDRSRLIL